MSWHLGSAVSTGTFYVWAVNQTTGTWYDVTNMVAVGAQLDYTTNWTVDVPAGSYRLTLWYQTPALQLLSVDNSVGLLTVL